MALNKKVYGVRMAISAPILAVHGILLFIPKAENLLPPIRNWQPWKTSAEAAICLR